MSNHYEALGLAPDCSPDDIKSAFRKLARENHPDANPDDPDAAERYKAISQAYAVLSDPAKRNQYDSALNGGDLGVALEDLFGAFFGGGSTRRRTRARSGESLATSLEVSFPESVFGGPQTIDLKRAEVCTDCAGSGCAPGTTPDTCTDCSGSGQRSVVRESFLGRMMTSTPCTTCEGSGFVIPDPCRGCRGSGRVVVDSSVEFNMPGGFNDADEFVLRGEGNAGIAGGPPGDLIVRLKVTPDPRFIRRGDDLITEVEIPLTVAALGGNVVVPTLEADDVVTVDPGTQSGDVHTIHGQGHAKRRGRGDLHAIFRVATPTALDDEQRDLLRRLASLRGEEISEPGGLMAGLRKKLSRDD